MIQMLYNASTNKYPKYFPYPMLLLKKTQNLNLSPKDWSIMDLNYMAYSEEADYDKKMQILADCLKFISDNRDKYEGIYVNMGEFPPDADKNEFFDQFINLVKAPVKIMGIYPTVEKQKVEDMLMFNDYVTIEETDFDVSDVVIPSSMLARYPKVGGLTRASMRITYGCPRKCNMCPTYFIYKQKFKFCDTEKSIERIKAYYDAGVRYITFVDDNLSCAIGSFTGFLKALKEANLKGMKYICQEGFEVTLFLTKEVPTLLHELNFEDVKIGFENINERFLKSIDKYHNSKENIIKAINICREVGIQPFMLCLIGGDLTEAEIDENIEFCSRNKLNIRVNIMREYSDSHKQNVLPKDKLRWFKSVLNSLNFFVDFDVDICNDSIADIAKKLNLTFKTEGTKFIFEGKVNYGFQRSNNLQTGLKYRLQKEYNDEIKFVERVDNKQLIFEGTKNVR
jgi:hypothetical protein